MSKQQTITITKEQLTQATCDRRGKEGPLPPCGAHKQTAERIWERLMENNDE